MGKSIQGKACREFSGKMSKRKAKKKIITEKPSQGKPLPVEGWSFHQYGLVLLLGLFLMILTFATFEQVRTCAFINLDDGVYVTY
jgi:hypothetical protein